MNERHRTNNMYNLNLIDYNNMTNIWEMPIINNDNCIPDKLIGFNYAKSRQELMNDVETLEEQKQDLVYYYEDIKQTIKAKEEE